MPRSYLRPSVEPFDHDGEDRGERGEDAGGRLPVEVADERREPDEQGERGGAVGGEPVR